MKAEPVTVVLPKRRCVPAHIRANKRRKKYTKVSRLID
jgi:hypothetical protein